MVFARWNCVFIIFFSMGLCAVGCQRNIILKKGKWMKFSEVTESFATLQSLPGRIDMTKELAILLSKASPEDARLISYLCLGQLRAPSRPTRGFSRTQPTPRIWCARPSWTVSIPRRPTCATADSELADGTREEGRRHGPIPERERGI